MKNVMEKVVYLVIQKVVIFIRKVIFVNEDFFSLCVRTFFLCVCVCLLQMHKASAAFVFFTCQGNLLVIILGTNHQ